MVKYKVATKNWCCDTAPNECPVCHRAIQAVFVTGVVRKHQPMGEAVVEMIFQCPHAECLHAFIGRYRGDYDRTANDHRLALVGCAPYSPAPPPVPPEVSAVSSQFPVILAQAAAAEAWRLDQIAGMGYRKALEFLVKDYCISRFPNQAEEIKEKFLGRVIADYIDDPNIKQCAERAAWLGNDETHYVRLWTGKDLADLESLVALTVSWVNTHLLTAKYLKEMPR